MDRPAQMGHGVAVGHVHRRKRGAASFRLNAVVQLFEAANGAGDSDDVMVRGQRLGQGKAEAARGAGDEGNLGHVGLLPRFHGRVKTCNAGRRAMENARRRGYSAAFIWKPFSIMSAGSTGYSPEKQASQYCGQASLRPEDSPTAR